MKRLLIGTALLAAVGGGAYWAWSSGGEEEKPGETTRTVVVERGTLTWALQVSGEVRPKRLIELKSKASGQITMFALEEGKPVKPGEILVELDPIPESRNHERAKANLEAAEARRDQIRNDAVSTLFRTQSDLTAAREEVAVRTSEHERLAASPATASKSQVEAAHLALTQAKERFSQLDSALKYLDVKQKSDFELAESEVKTATVALREAEDRLADTKVKPPIEGVLLKKLVEEGQIVSSGISSVSGGTTLALIADLSTLIIIANVVESDVGKVKLGQEARVGVDAYPGRKFHGTVIHIPPQTEVEEGIAHFKVKVAVPGDEAREFLRVGMTADIELLIDERPNVLKAPSEAVVQRKGKAYLRRADGSEVEVTIGLDTGLEAEVVGGVAEGDEILVPVMAAEPPRWMRRGR